MLKFAENNTPFSTYFYKIEIPKYFCKTAKRSYCLLICQLWFNLKTAFWFDEKIAKCTYTSAKVVVFYVSLFIFSYAMEAGVENQFGNYF